MVILDIVIGALLVWGLYKGFRNGLFVELASIVALIAGIYGAIHFSYFVGDRLSQYLDWNPRYIGIASFLITLLAIISLVNLGGRFLTKIANFALLGFLNKLAGGIFGALKVAVVLGAMLVFVGRVSDPLGVDPEETASGSILYAPIRDLGGFVFSYVLKELDPGPEESIEPSQQLI